MDLNRIAAFVRVVHDGSFTAAAKASQAVAYLKSLQAKA